MLNYLILQIQQIYSKFNTVNCNSKRSENSQFFKFLTTNFKWSGFRAVHRSASCRSWREFSNVYLLAKDGFDTVENQPCKVYRSPRRSSASMRRSFTQQSPQRPEALGRGSQRCMSLECNVLFFCKLAVLQFLRLDSLWILSYFSNNCTPFGTGNKGLQVHFEFTQIWSAVMLGTNPKRRT